MLIGWQSVAADARGTKAHTARCGKPERLAGDLTGKGEKAPPAAELPHGWRMWN